ncbi:MAG TPA: RNA-binding protein [Mucilaginibacter sp.]|jgi:RNA recognition motif-containing protein|nr:RNA-binding protein [Mucilaginibacter sp.]
MKIFIANVPHKMEESELKQTLTQFGQVASIKLVTDKETGKRTGWGFIEMPVNDQVKAAITALNGKEVYGRKIALSEAVQKEQERSNNFQRPRREFRTNDRQNNQEVDGNKW